MRGRDLLAHRLGLRQLLGGRPLAGSDGRLGRGELGDALVELVGAAGRVLLDLELALVRRVLRVERVAQRALAVERGLELGAELVGARVRRRGLGEGDGLGDGAGLFLLGRRLVAAALPVHVGAKPAPESLFRRRSHRHQNPNICLRLDEGRAEDHDEHRREDEDDRREEHLDRRLHRLLLGGGLALEPAVGRLDAQDLAERDAELVGLDDRAHERGDLGRVDAPGELLQRLRARLADAHLAERERELVDERALHVLGQLRDRAVEAEAGLDADREQVERVGKLPPDLLPAARRAAADDPARRDAPARREREREQEAGLRARDRREQEPDHERRAPARIAFAARKPLGETSCIPAASSSLLHRVEALARVQAEHQAGEPARDGNEHPLVQRRRSRSVGCVAHGPVVRGAADEGTALPLGQAHDLRDEEAGEREQADGDDQKQHLLTP